VRTYNDNKKVWNVEQAAALTLFSAFYDGVLKFNDLSYSGQVALMWAENHIDDTFVSRPVVKQVKETEVA